MFEIQRIRLKKRAFIIIITIHQSIHLKSSSDPKP
jgi:hypothetical protein